MRYIHCMFRCPQRYQNVSRRSASSIGAAAWSSHNTQQPRHFYGENVSRRSASSIGAAAWSTHNTQQPRHFYGRECALPFNAIRQSRSRAFGGDNNSAIMFPADGDTEINKLAKDRYAVVEIQAPIADGENTRLSRKDLTISEIVSAMPETLPRDFISLKPTSLRDATTRKRRAATNHYPVKGSIHPVSVFVYACLSHCSTPLLH